MNRFVKFRVNSKRTGRVPPHHIMVGSFKP
jgi:hypothetical protein